MVEAVEIFLQARIGSKRLPGKVIKEVLGKPLILYQIERLREVKGASQLVLLTTKKPEDDCLEALCAKEGVICFRGSEEDLLDRFYQAACKRQSRVILRSTADCPLIDPEIIDQGIEQFFAKRGWDYLSNSLERTFPRGLDFEIFTMQALRKSWEEARDPWEREHVTPYIYRHPELFRLQNIAHSPSLAMHRWTVDTKEDFALIQKILEALYPSCPHFRLKELLALFRQHPDWAAINSHISQAMPPPLSLPNFP